MHLARAALARELSLMTDSFDGVQGPKVYEGKTVVIWKCPRLDCSYAVRSNEPKPGFRVWTHRRHCTKDNSDPTWLNRSPKAPRYATCSGCAVDAGPPWLSCWECGWVQICVECQQRDHVGDGHRVVDPATEQQCSNDPNQQRRRQRVKGPSMQSSSSSQMSVNVAKEGTGHG